MQIFVDGRKAAVKEGSSFDIIAENRMFSGSDTYSLNITFPLAGCPENIDIFGMIFRPEFVPEKVSFECEIRDSAFSRFGSLAITQFSTSEVKCQFLEGLASQNYNKSFDDVFVNELDLGSFPVVKPSAISTADAWNPARHDWKYVALPWVSADSGIDHNFVDYDTGRYSWPKDADTLTWQPYLLFVTEQICRAVGYSADMSAWRGHRWLSKILICNTLPYAWNLTGIARVLPHWSVAEFFEKLGLFLRGSFEIDHKAKTVSFSFFPNSIGDLQLVALDKVVDEFSGDVSSESNDCDFLDSQNVAYKSEEHQMQKLYSCDWLIDQYKDSEYVKSFANVRDMMQWAQPLLEYDDKDGNRRDNERSHLMHVRDIDQYFIFRTLYRKTMNFTFPYVLTYFRYFCIVQPVNEFGMRRMVKDSDDGLDLEFVPACIDFTDEKHGFAIFSRFSSYSEESQSTEDADENESGFVKFGFQRILDKGEAGDTPEYFSSVSVAYYDGDTSAGPRPWVSNVRLSHSAPQESRIMPFSFRLSGPGQRWSPICDVVSSQRISFSFLADSIPDPKSLFIIRGRRFICEKITATFSDAGMSQLLKGDFFPILD